MYASLGHRLCCCQRFVFKGYWMRGSNHVSSLFPTCYPEASRPGVPLDCLAFISCRNRLQKSALSDAHVSLWIFMFVSDALHT